VTKKKKKKLNIIFSLFLFETPHFIIFGFIVIYLFF